MTEKALTRADILAAQDYKREPVDVPQWGGRVWVRTMSGTAKDQYEQSCLKVVSGKVEQDMVNMRAKLLAATLCDESGRLLFSAADVPLLGEKSAYALDKCYEIACRLNAVTDADLEELAKN